MRWLATVLVSLAVVVALAACSSSRASVGDAAVDTAVDTAVDPCLSCRSDQICVVRYDGVCGASVECITRIVDCAVNTCSAACEAAYCAAPYQCRNRPPCSGGSPQAFGCFGP